MFPDADNVEQRLLKLMIMNLSCYAFTAFRRLYFCVAVIVAVVHHCAQCALAICTNAPFQTTTDREWSQPTVTQLQCLCYITGWGWRGASCICTGPRTRCPPPGQTGRWRGSRRRSTLGLNMQVKLTIHRDRDMHKNFNFSQGNLILDSIF